MEEIKHRKNGGAFVYMANGLQLGEMVYTMAGDTKMIIEHTEVDESRRGRDIGKQLLERLIEFARERHIKVIPLCPFASAMFRRNKAWQDVLA